MQKQIKLGHRKISYILKTSQRARRMRLAIHSDGSLVVTRPYGLSDSIVEKFIIQKAGWILSKIDYFKKFGRVLFKDSRSRYLRHKEEARDFILGRIKQFNEFYQFKFNKISVRNQKTRWGSCSKKGNLNFNYKLLFLPKPMTDYIIVHELCHLKEFNHSKKFWQLVGKVVPDYLLIRKKLRKSGLRFY